MNLTSLQAKGVEPLSSQRAELTGWQLRFNVQHFFRHEGGVGNIEYTGKTSDKVLGVVHLCHDNALEHLNAAEAYQYGYDHKQVDIVLTDSEEVLRALTYVGMPSFINNNCRPSQRYLNIVVDGARQSGLDNDYIDMIASHPVHQPDNYPAYVPPKGNYPEYDSESLAQNPEYTALYNAVFDMSVARPYHDFLKGFFGGRDMTLFHLKRMDSSDGSETQKDIANNRLTSNQMNYLNAYLHEYAREYRYIGRYLR